MENKKKLIWILLALLALLLAVAIWLCCADPGAEPQPTEPEGSTTQTEGRTEPVGTDPTRVTEPTAETLETTAPPQTDPTEATKPSDKVPPTTQPTEPEETEPVPVVTDPNQILSRAREKIRGLSGTGTEVGSVTNPKTLTVRVSDTQSVEAAAQAIADAVKSRLSQEQSQAGPNASSALTYDYTLVYQGTENGQHTFLFKYRVVNTNYEVTQQQYDTSRLVADICAYLNGKGKVKFDSYGASNTESSSVIVLMEYDYETALSIVKAQVDGFTAGYRNYDFYFSMQTVTTKGGVEKPALLFYIVVEQS